ncbi:MAG: TSUP family transporter [Alphaproteobacteria bacterium]
MALVEFWPLVLISLIVCLGAALQVATGVGLGLVAGPALILSLPKDTAVFVAIILNLLISLVLLPQERRDISWSSLRPLLLGTLAGVPLGWLVLQQISATGLTLVAGFVVLAAAAQLFWGAQTKLAGKGAPAVGSLVAGGVFSGVMSGAMAVPGPVAMWALLQAKIDPGQVRATLRAVFVFSYSAAFLVHFGLGDAQGSGWGTVVQLMPALLVGVGVGMLVKRLVGYAALNTVLRFLLLAMGASLLWKGLLDVVI